MKSYYLALSRLSLAIILLQAGLALCLAFRAEKINLRIDALVESVRSTPAGNEAEGVVDRGLAESLAAWQRRNKADHWLLKGILLGALIHVAVCYSLYIHFLRMGYSWTKVCLHGNNLSLSLLLPGWWSLLWLAAYLVGTRLYKHRCVAGDFEPA